VNKNELFIKEDATVTTRNWQKETRARANEIPVDLPPREDSWLLATSLVASAGKTPREQATDDPIAASPRPRIQIEKQEFQSTSHNFAERTAHLLKK
jgi:hypothetical protein